MALPNVFSKVETEKIIQRINNLNANSQPQWGKMSVDQMLGHCNVTYEMAFEDIHAKPNFILKFILGTFVKNTVVNEVPYKKNSGTAPQFIIKGDRDFEKEKGRLIAYLNNAQQLGQTHFEGKESHSFGNLTASEWNNMFYKHLDHHLGQFGV
jgi:Protein of unknown function (DUF1569)